MVKEASSSSSPERKSPRIYYGPVQPVEHASGNVLFSSNMWIQSWICAGTWLSKDKWIPCSRMHWLILGVMVTLSVNQTGCALNGLNLSSQKLRMRGKKQLSIVGLSVIMTH